MKTLFNSFLAVSAVVLLLSANMLQAQTVIKTWDFESILDNWVSGGGGASIQITTEKAHGGSQSIKMVETSSSTEINLQNDVYEPEVGDSINFWIWISAADLVDVNGVQIFWQDGSGWSWHNKWINGTDVTGDGWTAVGVTFPALASPLQRIGLQITGKSGTEASTPTLYVDDITVSRAVVPVELVSFTANVVGNKVTLSWRTATEKNNAGFEVQKSKDGKEYVRAGYVDGKGTTTEKQSYSYIDNITSSGKCYYRLKQTDYDGTFSYSSIVEVSSVPMNYDLSQNYPNPFNPVTTIQFSMPKSTNVNLLLVDILGNVVKVMADGLYETGSYKIQLDASNLAAGVYFYRLEAGSFVDTKKLVLMK